MQKYAYVPILKNFEKTVATSVLKSFVRLSTMVALLPVAFGVAIKKSIFTKFTNEVFELQSDADISDASESSFLKNQKAIKVQQSQNLKCRRAFKAG